MLAGRFSPIRVDVKCKESTCFYWLGGLYCKPDDDNCSIDRAELILATHITDKVESD